jgi:hypothetical protein
MCKYDVIAFVYDGGDEVGTIKSQYMHGIGISCAKAESWFRCWVSDVQAVEGYADEWDFWDAIGGVIKNKKDYEKMMECWQIMKQAAVELRAHFPESFIDAVRSNPDLLDDIEEAHT